MNVDLELVLVIGVLLTGFIWLFDRLFVASARQHRAQAASSSSGSTPNTSDERTMSYKEPWYVEYSKSFLPVLLIVLVLRSFVAEPFRIPSGSMMPTLLVGDFILVNKFAYGLRLPVAHLKILELGEPQRGDVAVFRFPRNPSDDYIKRIVGLPGDHIAYYDKVLYVNGQPMKQLPVGDYAGIGSGIGMSGAQIKEEILQNVTHDILLKRDRMNVGGGYIDQIVPPGHYFVLGDNRDNSNDSRFWGFVPEGNLVGKAFMIWFNWDIAGGVFDYKRIGDRII
jgi:signal peptidase I